MQMCIDGRFSLSKKAALATFFDKLRAAIDAALCFF